LEREWAFCFSPLTTCVLRLTIEGLRYVYPPKVELYRRRVYPQKPLGTGGFTPRSLGVGGRYLSAVVPRGET